MQNLTLGDRLKKARKDAKMTQKELLVAAGMKSQGQISDLENGRNKSSTSLPEIAKALGVSYEWLAYGKDPKEDKPSIEQLKAMIAKAEQAQPDDISTPYDTELVDINHNMDGMMPVISWVAAGAFVEVIPTTLDDIIEYVPRPKNLSCHAFGLIVQGRSMYPEFRPGDIIYIEPTISPLELKDGDLIVIQCNDDKEATFKQLVIGDTSADMYLRPLNSDWVDQKIIPMGECRLVGIVDSKYVKYR
ncbi:helix-turn-helix domain-containing protein [Moraxella lincolnii]|uniref:HTH cro/C1-type domain-containing protein n=1 Tax=Lwoffella lincolnii TaxID=90241 RepID=A0A1T0CK79_9GAMM|nr:XRE family transcriptional regulator [Moraxella lincolnii]OOS22750.1 hypothetical protein B0682_00560 [Moraxella lincolnii]